MLVAGAHRGCTWLLNLILQENLGQASLECSKHPGVPCIAQGSLWEEDHTHRGLGDFSQSPRRPYDHREWLPQGGKQEDTCAVLCAFLPLDSCFFHFTLAWVLDPVKEGGVRTVFGRSPFLRLLRVSAAPRASMKKGTTTQREGGFALWGDNGESQVEFLPLPHLCVCRKRALQYGKAACSTVTCVFKRGDLPWHKKKKKRPHKQNFRSPVDFLGYLLIFDRSLTVVPIMASPTVAWHPLLLPTQPQQPMSWQTPWFLFPAQARAWTTTAFKRGPLDPHLQTLLVSPLITMRSLFHEELDPS